MVDAAPIFICYAGPDRAIAERLHGAIRDAGLTPWCDAIDLLPHETWDEVIPGVLRQARLVAILISHRWPLAGGKGEGYYGPEEVARAIHHARRHGTKLVPVRLDGVGRDRDPYGLFRVTGIDARSDALDRVVAGLRRSVEHTDEATPAPLLTDPLAQAVHLRALRAQEGASPKVLAALDKRILNIKRGRLHRHRPESGLTLDRWLLIEKLGRGGFAEVWAAEDLHTGETVALKILHAQFDDSAERRDRFFRGAKRMARLDHPHIARVIAPEVRANDRHFFAMECVPGGDLDAAVRAGRLDRISGLRCVIRIALAVAFAHDAGLIHRDIKPANILLDAAGQPKLTDFDLVRAGDTTGGTRTGALGTFLYAAPEAMEDAGRADERCDVYGLGMTALFVLLGAPPSNRVLRDPVEVLRAVEGFDRVKDEIVKAIEWEPEHRHPTARAFAAALEEALASVPVTTLREAGTTPGTVVSPVSRHSPALVYIPAGEFVMGSPADERGRQDDEHQHRVRVIRPLWMAETPVTVWQYMSLISSFVRGEGHEPVTGVSWLDAIAYCNALSDAEGLEHAYSDESAAPRLVPSATGYRLPTEAEWEYACRAGTTTRFWSGDDDSDLDRVGWFVGNSERRSHRVAEKDANPWGLHDMHGNVWEWCHDGYGPHGRTAGTVPLAPPTDPPVDGVRVLRGGSSFDVAHYCRSARRFGYRSEVRYINVGFRFVRLAPAP